MIKIKIEVYLCTDSEIYEPVLVEEVSWTTNRVGSAGQLEFTVMKDEVINFHEGDAVRLTVNDTDLFYGFVFLKKRDTNPTISVIAYDQLRYLKNKDYLVYSNLTASEFIKNISSDYLLNLGDIENTNYKIASRVEDNQTLFDMIQNALDITMENTKEIYVFYDDFGKLTLKNISSLIIPLVIDEETGESFDYSSSIDNSYNQIRLIYNNDDTGQRDVYIAKDSSNINKWGLLQYFDTVDDGENGKVKADALLELYNKKTRTLSIKKAIGDVRVRAGSMIVVQLNLGDVELNNLMLVEKCKHTFLENQHYMDLSLRGGEFVV